MVSVSVCVHESVCICMCVWCAKYEISIFGMYANDPKSVKCKNGICIFVCMCLCTFIFLCVCGVCAIYKLSIFGIYAK